jgi:hypothetical protein
VAFAEGGAVSGEVGLTVIVMRTWKTFVFCGALAFCPAMASGQTLTHGQATSQRTSAPARAPGAGQPFAALPFAEEAEYAARELQSSDLESFKGGASLSITLGTTALIVVAVLVALLIIF